MPAPCKHFYATTIPSPKVPPTPFPSASSYQQKKGCEGSSLMAWGRNRQKIGKSHERGAVVQRQAELELWNVPCGRYPLSPPLHSPLSFGFCRQNKPSSSGSITPFPPFSSLLLLPALLKERIGAPPF
ncbi:hypothetical protein CEXT_612161 [Caerostris extrusa]|uniref:Uncharacterized protein n=1 Tax=Caerostris extrusa TaxID=172846 RepID=A0AAV4MSP9_CAEEX|nr:hypothetical protein CEXT_612161 [Caerostris extrusa]